MADPKRLLELHAPVDRILAFAELELLVGMLDLTKIVFT
jgi:hypothetical protein